MKKRFLLLSLLIYSAVFCYGKSWYVNWMAVGNQSGNSWPNALPRLEQAIDSARRGDTIRVAAGTYVPTTLTTESARSEAFYVKSGVVMLGGYPVAGNPGDELRNFSAFPTYLSGDIGNGNFCYNVLYALYVDTATVVDGFGVIRNRGGDQRNGAFYILNSTGLVIRNMVFDSTDGGGVNAVRSKATIFNSVFYRNNAAVKSSDSSFVSVYNSVFANNGGGIYSRNAACKVVNCTAAGNGFVFYGEGPDTSIFQNSIFWNNKVTRYIPDAYSSNKEFTVAAKHTVVVTNCITEDYYSDSVNRVITARNPMFVNIYDPAGPDKRFFTADDGLQLTAPCSPGLNAGSNAAIAGITTDILGNSRVYGALADMGAYEKQAAVGNRYATVYVNAAIAGSNNNGSSWQNAFRSLNEALQYCADTIKVAAGTYLTANSSADSVFVVAGRVVLLGGYPAQGVPGDGERSPAVHRTLLKASYTTGAPEGGVALVKAYCNDSTSLIDGFEFDNSTPAFSNYKSRAPLYIDQHSNIRVFNCLFTGNNTKGGGGISINRNSSPFISRCRFISNKADFGGALVCYNSSPVISYCLFTDNQANGTLSEQALGGAMVFNASTGIIDSCRFVRNLADDLCTGIYSTASTLSVSRCYFQSAEDKTIMENHGSSNHLISNCTFKRTTGADFKATIYNNASSPVFTRCLFDSSRKHVENVSNAAPVFTNCVSLNGRFMVNRRSSAVLNNCTLLDLTTVTGYSYLIQNYDSSTLRAANTIFWGSRIIPGDSDINNGMSTVQLRNCITRNYRAAGTDGNLTGTDPRFVQVRDVYGSDGILFTEDDGLRLAPCSPAADAGTNDIAFVEKDAAWMPRKVGGAIDIGAYELQETPAIAKAAYVNAAATGKNNGSSWQDAYTNLQSAICSTCIDTIRVAAGTYYPSYVNNSDSIFLIERKLTLLGGYPASGTPRDAQRAPLQHRTILSGDVGKTGDSADNKKLIMQIVGVRDSVVVDGFTIRDANSSGVPGIGINVNSGAAVNVYYSGAVFRNCYFTRNIVTFNGGALGLAYKSRVAIRRCIFDANRGGFGAAIYSDCDTMHVSETVFENNNVTYYGGAIAVTDKTSWSTTWFDIHNCIFYNNGITYAGVEGYGGAIWAKRGSGLIYNCTFRNNSTLNASDAGGAVYMDPVGGMGITVFNNIFSGNTAAGSTTAPGADIVWDYGNVRSNLLQGNFDSFFNISNRPPMFKDSARPKGPDNIWFTEDDGLQLAPASPVIDRGIMEPIGYMPFDALDKQRIVSGVIDFGPYEYQNVPLADAGKDTAVCARDSIRIGTPGNPKHSYRWTSNPSGFTSSAATPMVTPSVTTAYYLAVSNGSETAWDTVVVKMSGSLTPSVNITASADTICAGRNITFHATASNGGSGASYKWLVNGVDAHKDSAVYSTVSLSNGSQVKVVLTSSLSCALPVTDTSNVLTVAVLPVYAPAVSIAATSTSICQGEAITFTASAINGGANPVFSWIKGGLSVAGGTVYTTSDIGNWDRVYVAMRSSEGCITANVVRSDTLVIDVTTRETPAVSIVPSLTNACAGTFVSFTASAFSAGNKPEYQWYRNNAPVGTGGTYYGSFEFNNGDSIAVRLTSSNTCVASKTVKSNVVRLTMQPVLTPVITINGISTVMAGDTVVLTAVAEYGGGQPAYQWIDSTSVHSWQYISQATGSTVRYVPKETGDKVKCWLTSNITGCVGTRTVLSEAVAFTVEEQPLLPSHQASVYPNPVTSTLYIDSLRAADEWLTAEVFNAGNGMRVLTQSVAGKSKAEIDVRVLPAGVYILVLRNQSGEKFSRRFLKI